MSYSYEQVDKAQRDRIEASIEADLYDLRGDRLTILDDLHIVIALIEDGNHEDIDVASDMTTNIAARARRLAANLEQRYAELEALKDS